MNARTLYGTGGKVSGLSGLDAIPARLTKGEYVISKDSVDKYGTSFFDSLNSGKASGFAKGGPVGLSAANTSTTMDLFMTSIGGAIEGILLFSSALKKAKDLKPSTTSYEKRATFEDKISKGRLELFDVPQRKESQSSTTVKDRTQAFPGAGVPLSYAKTTPRYKEVVEGEIKRQLTTLTESIKPSLVGTDPSKTTREDVSALKATYSTKTSAAQAIFSADPRVAGRDSPFGQDVSKSVTSRLEGLPKEYKDCY